MSSIAVVVECHDPKGLKSDFYNFDKALMHHKYVEKFKELEQELLAVEEATGVRISVELNPGPGQLKRKLKMPGNSTPDGWFVPRKREAWERMSCKGAERYPRLGAFEVDITRCQGLDLNNFKLFSKISTGKWPKTESLCARLKTMIEAAQRGDRQEVAEHIARIKEVTERGGAAVEKERQVSPHGIHGPMLFGVTTKESSKRTGGYTPVRRKDLDATRRSDESEPGDTGNSFASSFAGGRLDNRPQSAGAGRSVGWMSAGGGGNESGRPQTAAASRAAAAPSEPPPQQTAQEIPETPRAAEPDWQEAGEPQAQAQAEQEDGDFVLDRDPASAMAGEDAAQAEQAQLTAPLETEEQSEQAQEVADAQPAPADEPPTEPAKPDMPELKELARRLLEKHGEAERPREIFARLKNLPPLDDALDLSAFKAPLYGLGVFGVPFNFGGLFTSLATGDPPACSVSGLLNALTDYWPAAPDPPPEAAAPEAPEPAAAAQGAPETAAAATGAPERPPAPPNDYDDFEDDAFEDDGFEDDSTHRGAETTQPQPQAAVPPGHELASPPPLEAAPPPEEPAQPQDVAQLEAVAQPLEASSQAAAPWAATPQATAPQAAEPAPPPPAEPEVRADPDEYSEDGFEDDLAPTLPAPQQPAQADKAAVPAGGPPSTTGDEAAYEDDFDDEEGELADLRGFEYAEDAEVAEGVDVEVEGDATNYAEDFEKDDLDEEDEIEDDDVLD